ncbi:MAG: site-specific integrase, partial [Campylobacterota bacterium]|nr:site-specific integrase [Campylobacterota bacterium]
MSSKSELLVAFEEYLVVSRALDTHTISSYISDLTQLELHSQKTLTKLKTTDILAFLSTFENKRTLNRKLSSVNAFFHFCHVQQFTHDKIKIPMAKIPKNLPKYVSNEEI